jgi:stress responsive alpha/beta barrel protein
LDSWVELGVKVINNHEARSPMPELHHLALLKVRADAAPGPLEEALAAMRGLREKVDGVLALDAGPDISVEGLAGGFTHAIVVRFADEDARARYLAHPAHNQVAERLEPLIEGIVVVDLAAA